MSFIVRPAREADTDDIFSLSKQFVLLNLPSDKKLIADKIKKSEESFSGSLPKDQSKYMFVLEDMEQGQVVGSAQVIGKKGTDSNPNYSFEVIKKERFSPDLSVGFIHQLLRLKINTNGPTEVGGLVVDRSYRRRPEKVGRLLSLSRFMFIGMNEKSFESTIMSEMAPPLTDEGRSEFWEALGRRFTGMPYKEADALSGQNKEFIKSLFPEEDIYACLLDSRARLVMGQVSDETRPALHMLNKMGFKFNNEVDPFDGGPHLEVEVKDLSVVKDMSAYKFSGTSNEDKFTKRGMISVREKNDFVSINTSYEIMGDEIKLPIASVELLELQKGELVHVLPEPERGTSA